MIKLNECDLDYPAMTRFKVYYKKKYMGEYDKAEMVRKFGDKWLDMGRELGVRWVEIWVYG